MPTSAAPTTSEWSATLLSTKVSYIRGLTVVYVLSSIIAPPSPTSLDGVVDTIIWIWISTVFFYTRTYLSWGEKHPVINTFIDPQWYRLPLSLSLSHSPTLTFTPTLTFSFFSTYNYLQIYISLSIYRYPYLSLPISLPLTAVFQPRQKLMWTFLHRWTLMVDG